jgi:hypothetical protein
MLSYEQKQLIWDWTWDRLKVDRIQDTEDRFSKKFRDWSAPAQTKLTTNQGLDDDIPIYTGSLELVLDSIVWNLNIDGIPVVEIGSNDSINLVSGTDISIVYEENGDITINNTYTPPADEYVNSLEFDTATGILTLGRNVGSDLTKDLDGRYNLLTDVTYLANVNAENISSVVFTMLNGSEIIESFAHSHTEYALEHHHTQHEIGGSDEVNIDGGSF